MPVRALCRSVKRGLFFSGIVLTLRAFAADPIPEAEIFQSPTPARLAAIHSAAQREGWGPQKIVLRAAARKAYESDKLAVAREWFQVYRWASLWSQPEAEFVKNWIQAVQNAGVAHPNMPRRYLFRPGELGDRFLPGFQSWVLHTPSFSDEFFATLTPVDYLPDVFLILNRLYQQDPARFATYQNLALAIAVVYDVPPPPDWPHAQVSSQALPRLLPAPDEAFRWWVRQDQMGHTHQRLARLDAAELKFVVDAAAPFDDLEWSQKVVNYPLSQLAKAYSMIAYRADRSATQRPIWPGSNYSLPAILGAGGICVDQAYFATEVGKARGVPTLLFRGAGTEGRHAWFGFLDEKQHWQLDAGRYAEQRYLIGFARDPQTWREISDHELQFLSERFRLLPSFRQSQIHAAFAADYLESREPEKAMAAARKAVNYERRNQAAWDLLLSAQQLAGSDPRRYEATLHEAEVALQRYPDLEALYAERLAASLRARGETSAADYEELRIQKKNRGDRNDLAIQQAREVILRAMASQPLETQIRTYNQAVDSLGRGAGIAFFDEIVLGFVEHLVKTGHMPEARRALDRARGALKIDPESQLDQEMAKLAGTLRS